MLKSLMSIMRQQLRDFNVAEVFINLGDQPK